MTVTEASRSLDVKRDNKPSRKFLPGVIDAHSSSVTGLLVQLSVWRAEHKYASQRQQLDRWKAPCYNYILDIWILDPVVRKWVL